MPKILLTGATSFTGCHIARALADSGFEVVATLTRVRSDYQDPLVQKRMTYSKVAHWVETAPFGSDNFLKTIGEYSPEVFINHGAEIKGYRAPDFDYISSLRTTLHRAREVMQALAQSGTKRVIHSGSIFEPDEGSPSPGQPGSSEAMSIYGVSKKMAWDALRFFASESKLQISKIIIPNPVGPFENPDRLVPVFVRMWEKGEEPVLKTPHLIRDNVPAPWLARFYVEEARAKPGSTQGPEGEAIEANLRVRRPSAYSMSNQEFVETFTKRLRACYSGHCKVRVEPASTQEPLVRVNTEVCAELSDAAKEKAFWEEWFSSLYDRSNLKL